MTPATRTWFGTLILLTLAAVSPAHADRVSSSSHAAPCRIYSCAVPFVDTRTFALPPGNGVIPAYCASDTASVCTFAVQGNDDAVPGFGQAIMTTAGESGATLSIVACNNVSDPAHLAGHCPGSTRLTVITTTPDTEDAFSSKVCLVSIADALPLFRSSLCVDGTLPSPR